MLLWKDTFSDVKSCPEAHGEVDVNCPWMHWPRPPAGFLDFGSVKFMRHSRG